MPVCANGSYWAKYNLYPDKFESFLNNKTASIINYTSKNLYNNINNTVNVPRIFFRFMFASRKWYVAHTVQYDVKIYKID